MNLDPLMRTLQAMLESATDIDPEDERYQTVEFLTDYAREVQVEYAYGRFWITIWNTADGTKMALRLTPEQAGRMALALVPPAN